MVSSPQAAFRPVGCFLSESGLSKNVRRTAGTRRLTLGRLCLSMCCEPTRLTCCSDAAKPWSFCEQSEEVMNTGDGNQSVLTCTVAARHHILPWVFLTQFFLHLAATHLTSATSPRDACDQRSGSRELPSTSQQPLCCSAVFMGQHS